MKKIILTSAFFLLACIVSFGQQKIKENFNEKKGVAIEGYDPVSYFKDGPKKGSEEYTTSYNGVTYQFSSEANLKEFKAQPDKYEPQYGGWCAYAMGKSGDKVKIDPETYKITDGKLYLFYNFRNYNTLLDWNDDEANLLKKGDQYWQKIIN